jgi:hypothetical protein
MKTSVRAIFLTVAILVLAVGLAYGDTIVTFPSDNSFTCNINECDFMGNRGGHSEPIFTSGDFVTEIFQTGQQFIGSLTYDFFLENNLGGNSGHLYTNDVFINGTQVGSFLVPDCDSCGEKQEYQGTFDFAPLEGDGSYALSIVLGETVPSGDGNETFLSGGSATLGDVPEPGTFVLLGSGALALAGMLRRKILP